MMRVAGIAKTAPPMTAALPASPDAVVPAMLAASSAPTETPVATPMPPMICVTTSRLSVRRWIRAMSAVDRRSTSADTAGRTITPSWGLPRFYATVRVTL